MEFHELVTDLRGRLGVRLTAYIGCVKDGSIVTAWCEGRLVPGEPVQRRLRLAHEVLALIDYDPITSQSWFLGMNGYLDDEAPARWIREGRPSAAVLGAARWEASRSMGAA